MFYILLLMLLCIVIWSINMKLLNAEAKSEIVMFCNNVSCFKRLKLVHVLSVNDENYNLDLISK